MFFTSSKEKEKEIVGIIDIGSSQISGTIFELSDKTEISPSKTVPPVEDKPIADRLLFSCDEKITFSETPDASRFLSAISEALKKVMVGLKAGPKIPTRFFCIHKSTPIIGQGKGFRLGVCRTYVR